MDGIAHSPEEQYALILPLLDMGLPDIGDDDLVDHIKTTGPVLLKERRTTHQIEGASRRSATSTRYMVGKAGIWYLHRSPRRLRLHGHTVCSPHEGQPLQRSAGGIL